MAESDDPEFIERLKRREPAAFAQLVRTYQHRVFGVVYRVLGDANEAEDVAQEVFVSVFRSIDSFRGDARLSTWLFRVATNHSKNRVIYQKRRHQERHQELDAASEGDQAHPLGEAPGRPDTAAEANELERIVQQGLAQLDPEHREVLVLRDVEHLSYEEIAQVLGVAEGTVKSRLFRARYALEQRISARYAP